MTQELLVDTFAWLGLARDWRREQVIKRLKDLIRAHHADVVLLQIVIDEFDRDRKRVTDETRCSL